MTQGRKSRTVLAIGCALAALVTAAMLAPAFAGAQAADDEYNLTLPGAGAGGGNGSANHSATGSQSGGSSGVSASGTGQAQNAAAVTSSSSDSGGAPVLLILLAAIAAICTGVAVWRLRDRADDGPGKVGPGATSATNETQ
jgi:cobalamin biosynthesis Mg chelatase CobN